MSDKTQGICYHGNANVSSVNSRCIIGSNTNKGHNLSVLADLGINDSIHQVVFISWVCTSQHLELGPSLIHPFLNYVSIIVSNSPIELCAVQLKELIASPYNTTLLSNGSCCLNVVPSHHSHRNTSLLTASDARWHLNHRV